VEYFVFLRREVVKSLGEIKKIDARTSNRHNVGIIIILSLRVARVLIILPSVIRPLRVKNFLKFLMGGLKL